MKTTYSLVTILLAVTGGHLVLGDVQVNKDYEMADHSLTPKLRSRGGNDLRAEDMPVDIVEVSAERELTSSHDNKVYFRLLDNHNAARRAISIDCKTTSYSITAGQPWDNNNVYCGLTDNDTTAYFLMKAGRHGSSGPANYFTSGLTTDNMEHCAGHGDTSPGSLNFAATVDFTITYVDVFGTTTTEMVTDFRMGQGHSGSENNWWIGSTTCQRQEGFHLFCNNASGEATYDAYPYSHVDDYSNIFYLRQI